MSYGQIGEAYVGLFRFMAYFLIVSIPLAIWKLVDIAIWIANHVSIGVSP